jgi:hypothetical protein
MLHATLIRRTFNVQHEPTRLRILPSLFKPLHGDRVWPKVTLGNDHTIVGVKRRDQKNSPQAEADAQPISARHHQGTSSNSV